MMRLLGLDPGLRITGWGVVTMEGDHLRHVANGSVRTATGDTLAERLRQIHEGLAGVLERYAPDAAAIEETFVSKNAESTLKLGHARGVAMLVPAQSGVPVSEYAANQVKKAVVGVGHADKRQIRAMVSHLLPGCVIESADAADALAVAICHGHHLPARSRWQAALAESRP